MKNTHLSCLSTRQKSGPARGDSSNPAISDWAASVNQAGSGAELGILDLGPKDALSDIQLEGKRYRRQMSTVQPIGSQAGSRRKTSASK